MDWYKFGQVLYILTAALAGFWRFRSINSMNQFRNCHRRQQKIYVTIEIKNRLDKLRN